MRVFSDKSVLRVSLRKQVGSWSAQFLEKGREKYPNAVVLNMWVATPLGVVYWISCISDITIRNSSKFTVMR